MPKTIAIAPSHYWPRGVPRTTGIPPYPVHELTLERWERLCPDAVLLSDDGRSASAADLADTVRRAARSLRHRVPAGSRLAVSAGPTYEGTVIVLAALASGRPTIAVAAGSKTAAKAADAGAVMAVGDDAGSLELAEAAITVMRLDELLDGANSEAQSGGAGAEAGAEMGADGSGNGVLAANMASIGFTDATRIPWHSHRSILSHALSLRAFFGDDTAQPGATGTARPVVSTFSPCSWQGLSILSFALMSGSPLLPREAGQDLAATIASSKPGWLATSLTDAMSAFAPGGRRSKGESTGMSGALIGIDGSFDPDGLSVLSRSLGCPALSIFGMAETGPMIASHPSWYLAESAGIPLPNVHLVPTDPRSGTPITALWELVDAAMINVWSPSVMLGYEGDLAPGEATGRSFATGKLAASDPNGMLYLLDD